MCFSTISVHSVHLIHYRVFSRHWWRGGRGNIPNYRTMLTLSFFAVIIFAWVGNIGEFWSNHTVKPSILNKVLQFLQGLCMLVLL